jgi:hypothetical protein
MGPRRVRRAQQDAAAQHVHRGIVHPPAVRALVAAANGADVAGRVHLRHTRATLLLDG